MAADFGAPPQGDSEEDRQTAFARTSGCLSPEEADALEQAVDDGWERIDRDGWRAFE